MASRRSCSVLVRVALLLVGSILAAPGTLRAQEAIHADGFEDGGTRGWTLTFPPTCTDGSRSGDEDGVDCGGTSCPACTAACSPPPFGEIGGTCDSHDDCGAADSLCYAGSLGQEVYAPEGYCKVDDFAQSNGLCATDFDCPEGTLCVEWLDLPGYQSCMPACTCAGEGCPEHQDCKSSFGMFRLDTAVCAPGSGAALDGDPCAGVYECAELSACLADAEHPDGECRRLDCAPGDDATCNGGRCIVSDDAGGSIATTCVDTCVDDDECRTSDGYFCFDPDGGGSEGAYCRHPHVGDPCTDGTDCGGGSWVCQTGAGFDGGYCTLTACPAAGTTSGCTTGSVCHDPAAGTNYCVDRCTGGGQGSCRSGYLCLDVDPGGATTLGCVPAS